MFREGMSHDSARSYDVAFVEKTSISKPNNHLYLNLTTARPGYYFFEVWQVVRVGEESVGLRGAGVVL